MPVGKNPGMQESGANDESIGRHSCIDRAAQEGHNLEAPFYTSEDIFALDMEAIFRQHWIQVAVEPDIPEPGDYVTVELGSDSILIVRDDDMAIRAFHNVCRHRGARLCNEDKGSVGNIVCPYHNWTYNLTGQLMFAEHMGESSTAASTT